METATPTSAEATTPVPTPVPARKRRLRGTLVRIDLDKGFGFIRTGEEGKELEFFAHASAFEDHEDFRKGTVVTFIPGNPAKGRKVPPAYSIRSVLRRTTVTPVL
jgi:cold shock CspA family protein